MALFLSLTRGLDGRLLLVVDAYYASRHQVLTRVRSNAVAYRPAPRPAQPKRGRPRLSS